MEIKESPLFWPATLKKNILYVLDETQIPQRMHYVKVRNARDAVKVIRDMKTRAFGQFLVVLNTFLLEMDLNKEKSDGQIVRRLEKVADMLNTSRPTFPFSEVTSIVIKWGRKALADKVAVIPFVTKQIEGYIQGIRHQRLDRVRRIADIMDDGESILTHCNVSGELAMAAQIAQGSGKELHFFATETRPYFQGSKLTTWELHRLGAKVTLIADNAIGSIMHDGLVNKVIVGSDRSCANGDFANKIGTYQIAVLAKEFEIPFYVLTQPSNKVEKGEDIPIEIRNANELLKFYKKKIISGLVEGFYPGFDVVPNDYITEAIPIHVQ